MNKHILFCCLSAVLLGNSAWARVFNSSLRLKVYLRGSSETPDRVLGFTPSRKGHVVRVPAHGLWYVRPMGSLNASKLDQLAQLVKMEKIPGLDLSDHWELSNESLSHLRSLSWLTMLDISRTKISDKGLIQLKSCSRLAILLLPETISDEGVMYLKGHAALRELNLDQSRITDQGIETLARLSNLEILDLSSTHITDAGVSYLKSLPKLKRLVLGALITEASAAHLADLRSLNEIDVSQTQVAEKGLKALGSLPSLHTVFLPRQINDSALKALSLSRSLKALDLTRTAVSDKGIRYLVDIKSLEEIALSQTSVGNACLSALAELPELRMLELSETHVTSAGLAPLARLKKLEMLSLSWQKLTHEDLQGMAKLKQLKTIVLNGVPLPEATMAQLKQIGSPSPWDSIAGLERAAVREPKKLDQRALSAPVSMPSAARSVVSFPQLAKPTPASAPVATVSVIDKRPSIVASPTPISVSHKALARPEEKTISSSLHPEQIAIHSNLPTSASVGVATLKQATPPAKRISERIERKSESVSQDLSPVTSAPTEVLTKNEKEDNLLQTITLQSNPSHSGGFYGLSGMRQLRHTESLASINTLSDGGKSTISQEEDKPENYLGEISVGSGRSR